MTRRFPNWETKYELKVVLSLPELNRVWDGHTENWNILVPVEKKSIEISLVAVSERETAQILEVLKL